MTLVTDLVLSNELAEKANFTQANVSNVNREISALYDHDSIIKLGDCLFLEKYSYLYPKSIQSAIDKYTFTALTNAAPMSYVINELDITRDVVLKYLKKYIKNIKTVSNKEIIEFTNEFASLIENKVLVSIPREDMTECLNNNLIDGFIKVKSKYVVWY